MRATSVFLDSRGNMFPDTLGQKAAGFLIIQSSSVWQWNCHHMSPSVLQWNCHHMLNSVWQWICHHLSSSVWQWNCNHMLSRVWQWNCHHLFYRLKYISNSFYLAKINCVSYFPTLNISISNECVKNSYQQSPPWIMKQNASSRSDILSYTASTCQTSRLPVKVLFYGEGNVRFF